jgi:hypothetical protein
MEPDPEAFKVKTTPIANSAGPTQTPKSAQKETSAIPATKVGPGAEQMKAAPVTTETQKDPEAPQKDETTAPAPDSTTP